MTIHAPNFHAPVILHRKLSSKNNLGGNPIRAPDTRTPSTDATEQVHKQANRLYSKKPHKLWRYTTLKLAPLISYDSNKPLNYLQATLKKHHNFIQLSCTFRQSHGNKPDILHKQSNTKYHSISELFCIYANTHEHSATVSITRFNILPY